MTMTTTEKNADTKLDVKPGATTIMEKPGERRLRRWDPFDLFDEMQEDMTRLWNQAWPLMPWPFVRPLRRLALAPTTWTPSADIFEKDGNLVVKTELPGMKKDDIEVTLDQGDLVIRGERKSESEVKEEDYYRMERSYGSFYRCLPLGFEAKPDQISATYKDGVLEVHVPKPAQRKPQPHKIALK